MSDSLLSTLNYALSTKKKLVKARQVKVGMMQELLTGKTRLVESRE